MFSGLRIAWRLATWPTSRWPSSVKATTDGRRALPLGVRYDLCLATFHHGGDDGVGRAQVDPDGFGHHASLTKSRVPAVA